MTPGEGWTVLTITMWDELSKENSEFFWFISPSAKDYLPEGKKITANRSPEVLEVLWVYDLLVGLCLNMYLTFLLKKMDRPVERSQMQRKWGEVIDQEQGLFSSMAARARQQVTRDDQMALE